MRTGQTLLITAVLATVLLISAGPPSAQGAADPFGGAPGAPGADPFAGGAARPAPAPAAAPGGAAAPAALPIAEDERNPVVLAIRDMQPQTPKDLMFAVRSLFDIGRTDEAKFYLKKLIDLKPDRDALLKFHQEYGEAMFFRLTRDHRMAPEGVQFGQAVLDAAYQAARDPNRLRALVKQLSEASPVTRAQGIDSLRRAGTVAVPELLEALADPARSAEHAAICSALPQMGEQFLDPLLGALEAPDERLRVQVIEALGAFRVRRSLPQLVGPYAISAGPAPVREAAGRAIVAIAGQLPSPPQVAQFLQRQIAAYDEGIPPGPVDYENRVTIWRWDAAKKTSVPQRYEAGQAAWMMAARLAHDLYRLDPDNADYRRLYLLTTLTRAKSDGGLDQPLPLEPSSDAAQAAGLGVGPVEDALSCAMQTGKPIAAIAAAEILGQIGDEQLLASTGGQPRPLAMALRHSDRRLRLAAAQAILKIDPKQPYAGSSYLPETLGYILQTIGARRVLVVNPRVTHAQNLVGLLAEIGFVADTAATGREAFRRAADSADYEFALISDVTDFPNARETAQMLRKDPRTHGLPIGMLAREETLKQAEDFARSDPRMRAFPRPADAEGMAFRAAEILELAKQDLVGHSVRLAQARTAVDQLTRLAGSSEYAFYDLYRQIPAAQSALATPELSVQAAVLLGLLGSRNSQLSLVDLASQTLRPLAERQAAARGFATAVGKHGVLLTRDEILLQYQRYNQSENLDRGTQQVLASILDAIEGESRSADAQSKPSAQDASAS